MGVTSIGLLHPGEMGVAIGAVLVDAGQHVLWASEGRSQDSARRAESDGLDDAKSVEALCERCDLLIALCPPHAALELATRIAGFTGLYLDANAIAPATARQVASIVEEGGGRYLDGSMIGPPPRAGQQTELALSGLEAEEVAGLFAGSAVEARVISADPTAASALKMCYAAWTKGMQALLLGVRALARVERVEEELRASWQRSQPDLLERSRRAAEQAVRKGWRWIGEMEEVAVSFESAGLPPGFHRAAAAIYGRVARQPEAGADDATLDAVLTSLLDPTT